MYKKLSLQRALPTDPPPGLEAPPPDLTRAGGSAPRPV